MSTPVQLGVHLVRHAALAGLEERLQVPQPWLGVVSALRMIEGLEDEPPAKRALGIVGLDRLLLAGGDEAEDLLRLVRRGIHGAKRYFDWRQVPICFLVRGELVAEAGATAPSLDYAGHRWPLDTLLGHGLSPMDGAATDASWWWGPQLG